MYENLITFTKNLINSQALVGPADSWGRVTLLSPKPSPPPPPPPVPELVDVYAPRHPPAPPEIVGGRALVTRYEGNILDLEAREDELVLKLNDCFVKDRAEGTVCGLNSNEAPDPWMALDGVKCRGYDTRSAREGDYCGYWESDANPMAADSKKERQELLSVGPFCMAEVDGAETVAYCSPNATRTQRSGVTDVEYMIRPDREYCEFKFVRERLTVEAGDDIELCRANLTKRIERCHINCDACGAYCTSKTVRDIVGVAKCSVALPILGMLQAQHSSDLGLDIGFRWGAKRYDMRPANPSNSWNEKYRVLIQNSVDAPYAPRNSISCRKPHRESDIGAFHPPLDEEGHPVERKGFHVPCNTDLDCFSRCGTHPVSGMHYVCTHNAQMYTTAGLSKKAYKEQVAANEQLKAAGEPHPKIWLPDSNNEDYYLLDMPGDDKYDIQTGTGVCTDVHYDYMHTGCDSQVGSQITMGLTSCWPRAYLKGSFMCGILVDIDEDYVHSVGISAISLIYPRVLVEEAQINGITQQRITCWNPLDCMDKCDYYARKAHSGGLPSPPACALCSPPCPNNAAETIVTAVRALGYDILTAIRLAALCLNPVACVCQVFMLLRPAWIDNLPNELQECSAPDILMMILDKVAVALLTLLETVVNGAFVDPMNKILKPIKEVKIDLGFTKIKPFSFINLMKRLCIPYKDIKDCRNEQELAELAALLGCSWDDKQLWKRCYYERVKSICLADDEMVNGYKDLFQPDSQDELTAQYEAIVGDSFDVVDPSMQQLFDGANQEVNEAAQNICGDLTKGSLSLDKAILACVFHFIEEFCPKEQSDDNLIINLKTLRWRLDDVVFDWGASPPPPPPVKHGAYEDLLQSDPEGMEIAREKMLEFWPQLSNVAQQTSGANVGRDHSPDGLGYGPVYYVSKYTMSTAYLATSHFKDQDALSARIIQARFTGHFRFACQAFLEFMSDPTTSGAGSNNPEVSAFGNPDDFTSQYDRNWLAMASALFSESYFSETGHHYDTGVHKFWEDNCEAPAVKRSAVPSALWRLDKKVYGEEDLFSHDVPVHNYAPLRAFGSLRQLRNLATGGDGADFNEDYTNVADSDQFKGDRGDVRATNSLHALYRDHICNPTFKYSINDAIGNPPIGSNDIDQSNFIRDASKPKLPKWDMEVPNGMLGASAIRRPHHEGCGLGIESGGCDTSNPPTYFDTSLWSWAYVTSSHDPDVAPGWHRLLYLKAFTLTACSANKDQTCNSAINRATVGDNFDLDTEVARAFRKEQFERFEDKLAEQLRSEQPARYSYTPFPSLFGRRLEEPRRKLYVDKNGVFNLDAMIEETAAQGDLLKVTDRYYGLTRAEAALRFDLIRQKLKPEYITTVINGGSTAADPAPAGYRTGMESLMAARCSDFIKKAFPDDPRVHCCLNAPEGQSCNPEITYQSRPECNQAPLELADTNEETLGEEFLVRLAGMSPPPSPPPSPNPPPPPSPPKPPPPPAPPVAITADLGKSMALIAQRQFCDSVYILSAEARCSRLASAMMTRFVLGDGFSPPTPPPIDVVTNEDVERPPPPPPSPLAFATVPDEELARVVVQSPQAVTLSTYFVGSPEVHTPTASAETGNAMALDNVDNATREAAFQAITYNLEKPQWAQCSEALIDAGAVLPCRTGDFPHRCVNGARHCSTTDENTRAPWIELDLRKGRPTDRDYHFFALEVALPAVPELGQLFFQTAQGVSPDRGDVTNRFYELEVFDENHNPLATQCKPYYKQSVDFYTEGMTHFQYVCLDALADDAAFVAMRHVRFVRLTLLGEHRMLWLMGTRVLWRTLEALPPSLPPPPPEPPTPPRPVAPPDAPARTLECHEYVGLGFGNAYPVAFKEPCGLTAGECCNLAHDHNHTAAWHLSPSGCCTLLEVPEAEWADLASGTTQPLVNGEGMRPVVQVGGARKSLPSAYLAGG